MQPDRSGDAVRQQQCAPVALLDGRRDGHVARRERGLEFGHVDFGARDHRQVGEPQPDHPVLLRQLGATAELRGRGAHAATLVLRVAQSAERAHDVLERLALARVVEGTPVRIEAQVEFSARKMQVAAQRPEPRLTPVIVRVEIALGVVERGQRLVVSIEDAQRRGETEPAARTALGIHRKLDGVAIRRTGLDRPPERELHVAERGTGRGVVLRIARELGRPFGIGERALEPTALQLFGRRTHVGGRRRGVAGRGEVVRGQTGIPGGEPRRGAAVQVASCRPEQRFVHGVADQRVREAALVGVGRHETRLFERRDIEPGRAEQVPQRFEVESVTEHGGRLQRLLQAGIEALDAAQQQRAHGARQRRLTTRRRAQQLLEKQRVAAGEIDAALERLGRPLPVRGSEFDRLVAVERREVERGHRAATDAGAPGRAERVVVGPHGQCEQHGPRGERRREIGERSQFHRFGPVRILDDQQQRRRRRALHHALQRGGPAPFARGVVHRRNAAGVVGFRGPDQVEHERAILRRNAAARHGGVDAGDRIAVDVPGFHAHEARDQCRDGALERGLPEIEDAQDVSRDASLDRGMRQRLDDRRLADPRFATHDHDPSARRGRDALEQAREQGELRASADERSRCALRIRHRVWRHPVRRRRAGRRERLVREPVTQPRQQVVRDQHFPSDRSARELARTGHGASAQGHGLAGAARQYLSRLDATAEVGADDTRQRRERERGPDGAFVLVAGHRLEAEHRDRVLGPGRVEPASETLDDRFDLPRECDRP